MNRHLASRYQRIAGQALPLVGIWLATILSAWFLLLGSNAGGAVLAVLLLGLLWWRQDRVGGGPQSATHAAAAAAVVLALGFVPTLPDPVLAAGAAALLAFAMAAPMVENQSRPRLEAHRLPGRVSMPLAGVRNPLFKAACGGGIALAAGAAGLLPDVPVAVIVLLFLIAGAATAGYQVVRRRRHLPDREVHAALLAYRPDFYLYYSGRPEGAYQLQMWLPYLERTGSRGAVLIRERQFLDTALAITSLPVLLAESVEPIERTIVPTLGAIFYVNNAAKNVDGTRYQQVVHVHLGHGDSDKPASYAASTTMFDRIFVAGQAGVDRFASHGVLVPGEKFVLVGRPQVEAIEVRPAGAPVPQRPVVLYAPTWRGVLADMQLSSLASGEAIVSALLDAGAAVIFRAHPYAKRDAESRVLVTGIDALLAASPTGGHLTSEQAAALSIFDCMNASDALVGDVSSVVSDYLYSNKPIALAHHAGDRLEAEYPLAKATCLLPVDGDLAAGVRALLSEDSKAADRDTIRTYYLGPWPPEGYSQVFVDACQEAIVVGRHGASVEAGRSPDSTQADS
ncbi:MAG TPA: CDP-glycerol glycerophosphotransferase family protein [Propionicimonas sp.]|uniref:CDP-glycerol glycerophosphotransferase family protein n=1 Tax=Propionicimonas sp. TaxID=1955623 RepID=UPI002F409490